MRHIARYEVFEDEAGEWRWRLQAANGEIVAQSEGYGKGPGGKWRAKRGLKSAKESSAEADLEALGDDAA
jgi:uncharacterized protein YegP (UPF0339 family)